MERIFLPGPLADPRVLTAFGITSVTQHVLNDFQLEMATHSPVLSARNGQAVVGVLTDVTLELTFYLDVLSVTLTKDAGVNSFFSLVKETRPLQAGDAPYLIGLAEEISGRFHHSTVAQAQAILPMIAVRADARRNAVQYHAPSSPSGLNAADVRVAERRLPYANFFAMSEIDVAVPRFDGGRDPAVTRGVFLGTDAVILLPYDPIRKRVLLVEQFRPGPFLREDQNPWIMEPIAGRIDAEESAETAAHREAEEEAGLKLSKLVPVHKGYVSPGCSTEYFHSFVGICDLPDDVAGLGGLDGEYEDIKGHIVELNDFVHGLNTGTYPVVPLATLGYWLSAHNKDL